MIQPLIWAFCNRPTAILLLCLFSLPSLAAVIKVTPDRNPVALNETFNLVFSAEESPDDDPDFSPLQKDFEILSQSHGSQTSIINGSMSRKTEWTLVLTPKRAGTLLIPSIAFGDDHSDAATVTVTAPAPTAQAPGTNADSELFIEVGAEPRNPYVQAQVIYTARVFLRVNLSAANLSDPAVNDALIERLDNDHRYSASRGGQQYTVVERKYAIFPQKSGALHIEPLKLEGQMEIGGGRSFFSRPTRGVRIQSEALELKVRPARAEFAGKHWLPAENLQLEENWSQNPPMTKAGEPITRTLSLRARGATVGVLPELGADRPLAADIKQYPDQPAMNETKQADGISSLRQEKTALIPAKDGDYKLPAIEIPWWNTTTERMEVARIPERILSVAAAAETQPPAQAAASTPLPMAVPQTGLRQTAGDFDRWFWLALLFGLGWVGTAMAWWWSRRAEKPQAKQPQPQPAIGQREAYKTLQRACAANDPALASLALLDWARLHWPRQQPASLGELYHCAGHDLAEEIRRLEKTLYGRGEAAWNGEALWSRISGLDKQATAERQTQQMRLEPLYRR